MSKQKQTIKLVFDAGTMRGIYTDALAPLLSQATEVTISRASHVEPEQDGTWSADMSPVGGHKLTGYPLRQDALNAEVQYINKRVLI